MILSHEKSKELNLQFQVFKPRSDCRLTEKVYDFFEFVWRPVLKDLGDFNFASDGFLDADHHGVIFDGLNPIALHTYNFHDLNVKSNLHRKCFSAYTEEHIEKICSSSNGKIMQLEWMSVHPDYRKHANLNISELLPSLSLEFFKTSNASCALGTAFNRRKVNNIAYSLGAEKIGTSQMYGVDIDIIMFLKSGLKLPKHLSTEVVNELWNGKTLRKVA